MSPLSSLSLVPHSSASTLDEIAALREQLSQNGRKFVLTNGVFDLLHVGHIRYLAEARALGDALVVAINSDESTRALKGPGRPIHPAADRAEMLLALRSVDRVVVFDGRRATEVIAAIRPHLYVKGGDYTPETLIDEEKALLDRLGTEIRILSLTPGQSSSATLARINAADAKQSTEPPSSRPRLAILGSGRGSNARAILSAVADGRIDAEIAVVICDVPNAGIFDIAAEYGLPTLLIDPGTKKHGHLTDAALKELTDRLAALSIDVIACAGFMRILREPLLSRFSGRILNLHPSLLPKFPGLHTAERALEAGETESGCTVHLIDAGIDTGPILKQARVPILADDTADSLMTRIHEAEHRCYPEAIAEFLTRLRAEKTSNSGENSIPD